MTRLHTLRPTQILTIGLLAGLLAGCATKGEFPSLARRSAELRPGEVRCGVSGPAPRIAGNGVPAEVAPGATATEQAVPQELNARLAALEEAARAAHERFAGKRGKAATLVAAASGAAVGSESWSVATVAIADLESARSDAMVSLGELDRLYAAERIDGGDGGAIAAVRDQVTAWVADEDAALADLAGRIRG
jgi:hypothetical protein